LPLEDEIFPEVVIVRHWMLTLAPADIVPEELFAKVPELQVTVNADKPLTSAFTFTLPLVEVKVNELEEFGEVTELETVIAPELCSVALAEPI
jgi:hypothetical protein